MKIGVISDTHARTIEGVSARVLKSLSGVDFIVHAGDFTEKAVFDGLGKIAEVRAVAGNMDSLEIKGLLPQRELFVVGDKKIGLIHGSGGPPGIAERIRGLFDDADIIIFGHSHEPCNRYIQGTLLFNPGQAGNTFGLLTIGDAIKAEIVTV